MHGTFPRPRPDRPPPMERWVFVGLIGMGSFALGAASASALALPYGVPTWLPFGFLAVGGSALGYVAFRLTEAGWP